MNTEQTVWVQQVWRQILAGEIEVRNLELLLCNTGSSAGSSSGSGTLIVSLRTEKLFGWKGKGLVRSPLGVVHFDSNIWPLSHTNFSPSSFSPFSPQFSASQALNDLNRGKWLMLSRSQQSTYASGYVWKQSDEVEPTWLELPLKV